MDRILRSTRAKVKFGPFLDADGVPSAATAVTATVSDGAGIAVVTDAVGTAETDTGVYSVTLTPAQTDRLDTLKVVGKGTVGGQEQTVTDYAEVVGDFLFSLTDLRNFDSRLSNIEKYTNPKLLSVRHRAETLFEDACGIAFRPKGQREVVNGSGRGNLILAKMFPTKLVSASIGGTAFTASDLADVLLDESGVITRNNGLWTAGDENVVLHYEFGFSSVPSDVRDMAMKLAAHYAYNSALPDRAISVTSEEGTMQMANTKPTGLPDVDEVIERYTYGLVGVG